MQRLTRAEQAQVALGTPMKRKRSRLEGSDYSFKDEQAWKYPDCKIIRAPTLYLRDGVKHRDPKAPMGKDLPRRQQESNFMITINTNKSPAAHGVALEVAVSTAHTVLQTVMARLPDWIEFGKGKRGDPEFANDIFQFVVTKPGGSVEWDGDVETGPALNRLHTHILLRIVHYSQLRVYTRGLQETYRDEWNALWAPSHPMRITGLPYVDVKPRSQRGAEEIALRYLRKCR